jgi:hypothetical protein
MMLQSNFYNVTEVVMIKYSSFHCALSSSESSETDRTTE